jgi:hypothetical protein
MAAFQWWLLLVGLVAGGGLVAIVTMDGRRREEDLADLERRAEATWIADRVRGLDHAIDPGTVASILRIHREYLTLPPPDRIIVEGDEEEAEARPTSAAEAPQPAQLADGHADSEADRVGDDGGGRPDEDLPRA